MRRIVLLTASCVVLFVANVAGEYFTRFSEECDVWAKQDLECAKNVNFMWSQCIRSCIDFSEDDHDECEAWASEGECTNNPNYIQIHCPRSCNMAIAWSPWVRATLGKQLE